MQMETDDEFNTMKNALKYIVWSLYFHPVAKTLYYLCETNAECSQTL